MASAVSCWIDPGDICHTSGESRAGAIQGSPCLQRNGDEEGEDENCEGTLDLPVQVCA